MPYVRTKGEGRAYRLVLEDAAAQRWKGWAHSRARIALAAYLRGERRVLLRRFRISDATAEIWVGSRQMVVRLAAGLPPIPFDVDCLLSEHLTAGPNTIGGRMVEYRASTESWGPPATPDPQFHHGNLNWISRDGKQSVSWEGVPTRSGAGVTAIANGFDFDPVTQWTRWQEPEVFGLEKLHWQVKSNYASGGAHRPLFGPFVFWNGVQIRLDVPAEEAVMGAAVRRVSVDGATGAVVRPLLVVVVGVFADSWEGFPAEPLTTASGPTPRLPRDRVCVAWLDESTAFDAAQPTLNRLPVVELGSVGFGTFVEGVEEDVVRSSATGPSSLVSWFFNPGATECTAPRDDDLVVTDPATIEENGHWWHTLAFVYADVFVSADLSDSANVRFDASRQQLGTLTAVTTVARQYEDSPAEGAPQVRLVEDTTTVKRTYVRYVVARDYTSAGQVREAYLDGTDNSIVRRHDGIWGFDQTLDKDLTLTVESSSAPMVFPITRHTVFLRDPPAYDFIKTVIQANPTHRLEVASGTPLSYTGSWSELDVDWLDLRNGLVAYRKIEATIGTTLFATFSLGTVGTEDFFYLDGNGDLQVVLDREFVQFRRYTATVFYKEFFTSFGVRKGALLWTGTAGRTDSNTASSDPEFFQRVQFTTGDIGAAAGVKVFGAGGPFPASTLPFSDSVEPDIPAEDKLPDSFSTTAVSRGSPLPLFDTSAFELKRTARPGLFLVFQPRSGEDVVVVDVHQFDGTNVFIAEGLAEGDPAALFPDEFSEGGTDGEGAPLPLSASGTRTLFPGGFV